MLRTYTASRTSLRRSSLHAQFGTISPDLIPYIFRLYTSRSLDLLVFWRLPKQNRTGFNMLCDLKLGPGESRLGPILSGADSIAGGLYAESQRERTLLIKNIESSEYGQDDNPIVCLQDVPSTVKLSSRQVTSLLPAMKHADLPSTEQLWSRVDSSCEIFRWLQRRRTC